MIDRDNMRLGFIGSGGVARVLGTAYAELGHEVMLGSRDPSKLADWIAEDRPNRAIGTFMDVAEHGDVVFLCVPATAIASAIDIAGAERLQGSTLVDLVNPMDFSDGVPPKFTATVGNSIGEAVQMLLPETNVVKAFNTVGVQVMTDPFFNGEAATHFIAGNDDVAKSMVANLVGELGWEVVDVGGIDQSFFLEAFASLWVNYAFKNGNWSQAFKLLTR